MESFLLATAEQALARESWLRSRNRGVPLAGPAPSEAGPDPLRGRPPAQASQLLRTLWGGHSLAIFCCAFLGAFWPGQMASPPHFPVCPPGHRDRGLRRSCHSVVLPPWRSQPLGCSACQSSTVARKEVEVGVCVFLFQRAGARRRARWMCPMRPSTRALVLSTAPWAESFLQTELRSVSLF